MRNSCFPADSGHRTFTNAGGSYRPVAARLLVSFSLNLALTFYLNLSGLGNKLIYVIAVGHFCVQGLTLFNPKLINKQYLSLQWTSSEEKGMNSKQLPLLPVLVAIISLGFLGSGRNEGVDRG